MIKYEFIYIWLVKYELLIRSDTCVNFVYVFLNLSTSRHFWVATQNLNDQNPK